MADPVTRNAGPKQRERDAWESAAVPRPLAWLASALSVACLLLAPVPTFAAATPLGTVCEASDTTNSTTFSCTFNTSVSTGTVLLVSVATNASSGAVSVADTAGNVYGTALLDTTTNVSFVRNVLFGASVTAALN